MRTIIAGAVMTAFLAGAATTGRAPLALAIQEPTPHRFDVSDKAALALFTHRVAAYLELRQAVAGRLPPQVMTSDIGRIYEGVDALGAALVHARPDARQGDIFSPDIATAFRHVISSGCAEEAAELLAITHDEEDFAAVTLPSPMVHGRWPEGLPLTTMPADVLAALPRLPPELEYRFMNRDLVLRDVDANLIIDFITLAIVVTT